MYRVKMQIIENLHTRAIKGSGRNSLKNFQEMVDTIIDLLFIKTIDVYNDVKNRANARPDAGSGDGSSITGVAKDAVQNVSKLVAYKILELTGTIRPPPGRRNGDLEKQIDILYNVAINNKGYTTADTSLITYFIDTYGGPGNIKSGKDALNELYRSVKKSDCSKANCRVINNAVPNEIKDLIKDIVVCPTSSVCDGMGSFGSCVNPRNNREYANMNFAISYGTVPTPDSYYGQTNIKSDLTSVNINYGIVYKDLQIYNFIDIKIDSQPIVLQANYVFKNLINRIIEIWKTQTRVSNIDDLWNSLYSTDYYLSILKLGSQKAVGDIFQEINSTLADGGYNVKVQGFDSKKTFGLMGDRPSGVRVIKLLKDVGADNVQNQGTNKKASGGYVGGDTTLIYFSQLTPSTRTKQGKSVAKKGKGGGRITKKIRNLLKTKKHRRYSLRQTKKRSNKINVRSRINRKNK
jgi:hypothetical protein